MAENKNMTLGEVAAFLGWTPRFVERLAVGGRMPGREIDGRWIFERRDLIDWLDQKLQTLDSAEVGALEQALARDLSRETAPAPTTGLIAARLHEDAIDLELPATDREGVLRGLVALATATDHVTESAELLESIRERELLCSTALPGGVAIVHPRRPSPRWSRRPLLALARTTAPVDFGAVDDQPTRLFFLLLSHGERAHLHVLARLIRVLRGARLPALHGAPNPASVLEIIRRAEEGLDRLAGTGADAGAPSAS